MAEPEVSGLITPRGLRIPAAALAARLGGRAGLRRFLSALTVVERPQPGRPGRFARARRAAYASAGDFLYVPRAKAPALLGRVLARVAHDPSFVEARRLGGGVRKVAAAAWEPAQAFYAYQAAAAEHVCAPAGPLRLAGCAYVQMETGMGKSRFAMAAAARGRGPVFVVVPTKAIRLQWLDEFGLVFPRLAVAPYDNPPKRSRRVAPTAATHDVVVGIVNTVRAKAPGFFAGYATVVLDEAHELHSPKNLKVLWLAQEAPWTLGLSATPADRPDGLDRVVFHFLGAPIWAERDIPDFDVAGVSFRGRVREVEYAGDPEFCEAELSDAGTVCAIKTVGRIVSDPCRLRLVAAEVERLFRLHETEGPSGLRALGLGPRPDALPGFPAGGTRMHGVFVFAEHRAYLPALRAALLERLAPADVLVPELADELPVAEGAPVADVELAEAAPVAEEAPAAAGLGPVVLRGGASREEVRRAHRARIVLTTYGYSRRGVSLVDMTSIVLASPRRNGLRQILGRVTRRGSDESILRLVVDIKDVRTVLKGQSSARRAVYKQKGYPIHRVRVSHEDYAGAAALARPTADEELVWGPEGVDEQLAVDMAAFVDLV